MQRIAGIYVPGLGDQRAMGQDSAVKDWAKQGIDFEYQPLGWGDGESFDPKLERLCTSIDRLYETSGKVALMASSAGASAVLNAYISRPDKVRCVVSICGKIQNPVTLRTIDFKQNPAFEESLKRLPRTLEQFSPSQLDTVLSVHSLYDRRVPVADTKIPGAHEMTIPMVGHVASIAFALAFSKRRIAEFIHSR